MGEQVSRPVIKEHDFLRLWVTLGPEATYQEYADALSDAYGAHGEDRIPAVTVAQYVHRNRLRWQQRRGITIPLRRVDASEEFSAWPALPKRLRNGWLWRFLEYCAVARQRGRNAIPATRIAKFDRECRKLRKRAQVIRYDPITETLYRDERGPHEKAEDPKHLRFYESRAAFCERHPDACESEDGRLRSV